MQPSRPRNKSANNQGSSSNSSQSSFSSWIIRSYDKLFKGASNKENSNNNETVDVIQQYTTDLTLLQNRLDSIKAFLQLNENDPQQFKAHHDSAVLLASELAEPGKFPRFLDASIQQGQLQGSTNAFTDLLQSIHSIQTCSGYENIASNEMQQSMQSMHTLINRYVQRCHQKLSPPVSGL